MPERAIFKIPAPKEELEFTGERFTTLVQGEIRHEHFHRYFFALQFCANKTVLDIASGEGYGTALLSSVAAHVTGVDNSSDAVRHANINYAGRSAFFKTGRAETLPIADACIDTVVSFETVEHLQDHDKFLSEIKRVLRPGGLMIMSSPDFDVYSGQNKIQNPYHVKELSRVDFEALIRRHFAHATFFSQNSLMGSVIAPDSNAISGVGYQGFRRLYESCFEAGPGLPSAMYILCVASDSPLPNILCGAFDDRPFQLGLYAELQRRQEETLRGMAEICDLKQHLKQESDNIRTRDSELQVARHELTETAAQLEQTRQCLIEAERGLQQRDSELQVARHELTETTAQLEQTRQCLIEAERGLQQRDSELQVARHELTETTAQLEQTRQCLIEAERGLQQRDSELQVARHELTETTAQLEQTRQCLIEAERGLQQRDSELQVARHELTETTAQLEQTRQCLIEAERGLQQRDSDLQAAQQNRSEVAVRFDQTYQRALEAERNLEQCNVDLQTARGNLLNMTSQFAQARQRAVDAERRLQQRDSDLQHTRRDLSETTTQFDHARQRLIETEHNLERRDSDLQLALRQLGITKTELKEARQTLTNKQQGFEEDERRWIDLAETHLKTAEALRNSISWRITMPVRLLVDVFVWFHNMLLKLVYNFPPCSPLAKAIAKAVFVSRLPVGRTFLPDNPIFATDFYATANPDIGTGRDLWAHYIAFGAVEGRNPHPLFDTKFYLTRNPDVASSGLNPLIHYFIYGAIEGRRPHPEFDPVYYVTQRPDVKQKGVNPLLHYWNHGRREGMRPLPPKVIPSPPGISSHCSTPTHHAAMAPSEATAKQPSASPHQTSPLFSILVPTFNTNPTFLRLALESVRRQTYTRWQLCIYDDGSSNEDTLAVLKEYGSLGDTRILVRYGSPNLGIARASNAAFAFAGGDYVGMLDHDDELEPEALREVAHLISRDPSLDVVYTDQDYIDVAGQRSGTLLKPDWSPELFRGVMFVNHLLVVRREVASQVGVFDPAFDRIQDFEFMLRVSEVTAKIGHVRRILYHWRAVPGSVASGANAKGVLEPLQAAAVNSHLSRCGIRAIAAPHSSLSHRLTLQPMDRATFPRVIVALRSNTVSSLANAVASIIDQSTYPNLAVCIPPGFSHDLPNDSRIIYCEWEQVQRDLTPDEYLVFMDGDLEVATANWLETLLMYGEQPDVACAAPLIVYEGTVWCSGLVLGMNSAAGYVMQGWPADSDGYAGSLSCAREVSTVSGECMMISGSAFRHLGGSVKYYASAAFDGADIALRGSTIKKRNIVTPRAVIRKVGATSRQEGPTLDEKLFADRWQDLIRGGDPFYNPNFRLTLPSYSIVETPQISQ